MRYERPAIERRVELTSPVINGIVIAGPAISPGFSPTWKRPWRSENTSEPGTQEQSR